MKKHNSMGISARTSLLLSLLLGVVQASSAQTTIEWTGLGVDDNWNTIANWMPNNVPNTNSEIAYFPNGSADTVFLTTNRTIYALRSEDNVSIDLNGNNLTLTSTVLPAANTATNPVSLYSRKRTITFSGTGLLRFRSAYLDDTNSELNFGARVDVSQVSTSSVLQMDGRSEVIFHRNNTSNGNPAPFVKLQNINLENQTELIFSNAANNTEIRDLNFDGLFNTVEFKSNENFIFTTAQNWDAPDCNSYNTIRSEHEGVQTRLRFDVASSGDFNIYEDIDIDQGTLTADNRVEKNSTGISGSVRASASITSTGSGNWDLASSWSTGCVPTAIDDVTIQDGDNINIISGYFPQVKNLVIETTGSLSSAATSSRLEMFGDITVNSTTAFTNMIGDFEFRNNSGTSTVQNLNPTQPVHFFGQLRVETEGGTVDFASDIDIIDGSGNTISGDLIVTNGAVNFLGNSGLSMSNDLTVTANGTIDLSNGALEFDGIDGSASTISISNGSNLAVDQLVLNKFDAADGNLVDTNINIEISSSANFATGRLATIGAVAVRFLDDATATQANGYVEGLICKTGNDVFDFFIGAREASTDYLGTLSITAPAVISDEFCASYTHETPLNDSNLEVSLTAVSSQEYWTFDRVIGSSSIQMTLPWETNPLDRSGASFIDKARMRVSRYNGTTWESSGQNDLLGDDDAGSVTSDVLSTFSDFTFGLGDPTLVELGDVTLELVSLDTLTDTIDKRETLRQLLRSYGIKIDRNSELESLASRYLDADGDGFVARFSWQTLSQFSTLGFYLERSIDDEKWQRLNADLLPAVVPAPYGAEYMIFDAAAKIDQTYFYRLIEVESNGSQRSYGPFKLKAK